MKTSTYLWTFRPSSVRLGGGPKCLLAKSEKAAPKILSGILLVSFGGPGTSCACEGIVSKIILGTDEVFRGIFSGSIPKEFHNYKNH